MLCGCGNAKKNMIKFVSNPSAEYKAEFNACTLVSSVNGERVIQTSIREGVIQLANGKKVTCSSIDTSVLGKQKAYFDYEGQMYGIYVDVEDTIPPEITILETVTKKDSEATLKPIDYVTATDVAGIASIKIEGDYDESKAGEYNLTAVAIDKNGNKATKDFIYVVK